MANRKRLIAALLVMFAGLMVTGCAPAFRGEFEDAIYKGDLVAVKSILVEKPGLVNAEDRNPTRTPLSVAIVAGHTDLAKLLITKGAKVNRETRTVDTPLHFAAEYGNKEVAELLIAKGANVNAANGIDGRSALGTPLHYAVLFNKKEIVELLIAKGADVNAKDHQGQTPLRLAIFKEDSGEMAKLLLNNGADGNILSLSDKWSQWGETILFQVMSRSWNDVAELMIEKGVNVNAKNPGDGRTALHAAGLTGSKEMVELLIAKGADINAKDNIGIGHTPLDIAVEKGHKEIADLLRKHGAKE